MKKDLELQIAWLDQPGRIKSRMLSVADGFVSSCAVASVAVLAESESGDPGNSAQTVGFIRDSFAEGVAYDVEDELRDVLYQLDKKGGVGSLAVAVCEDRQLYVYSSGCCRAFRCSEDMNAALPQGRIEQVLLAPEEAVVLVTSGLRKLTVSPHARRLAVSCGRPAGSVLGKMVDETRIRFRKKGGSAVLLRCCPVRRSGVLHRYRRSLLYLLLAAAAASLLIIMLGQNSGNGSVSPSSPNEDSSEVVMPLDR
ncbi:MAG: hypothetical protein GF388_05155 [Candidatus Aegiribacteria sp.]|nr:hypothetical protein [Candidatus Aegiribacteria sp.]